MPSDPDGDTGDGRAARRALAEECVEAGIAAAHPTRVVADTVALTGDVLHVAGAPFDLSNYDEVVVLGGGNAASQVAAALESVLEDRLDRGLVVTDDPAETRVVDVLRGDHPIPSERGVDATRRVLELADDVSDDALVLAVVTGGASALLAAPAAGVPLAALRATTGALLDSGATIDEVNAVRKHLSAIKGGRLAEHLTPARVAALCFSDVVGDDLSVVGSGPVVADPSTYADALDVLDGYDVSVPNAVRTRLESGAANELAETPKPGDGAFARVSTHVLANNRTAVDAAADTAADAGYDVLVLSTRIRGEAREIAKTHVAVAEEALATGDPLDPPCVVASGGECTVTVRGDGEGGPNLEFALSAALEIEPETTLCTVDTDGLDGATRAAGAVVDSATLTDRRAARRALRENDALPVLDDADALVETGATGTNVNDLRVLVVGDPE